MTFYLKSHLFISSATSQPILRWSHHRSRHSNAPQPPMLIVSYNNTVREKSCHISQRLHNSLSTSLSASLNKLSLSLSMRLTQTENTITAQRKYHYRIAETEVPRCGNVFGTEETFSFHCSLTFLVDYFQS
jgi:hypothetical protein